MDERLHSIADQMTVPAVVQKTAEAFKDFNIRAGAIHITSPHGSQVAQSVFIASFGHTPEWTALYATPAIRCNDPFPDHAMRSGQTLPFARALKQLSLKSEQRDFIAMLRDHDLMESIAIPVYGPFDFDTYMSVLPANAASSIDEYMMQNLVFIAEAANRRLAQLAETSTALDLALSERENEVLNWMGRSKSIRDIATILNVTPATIDTYARRLYAKLGTNDRIAAVIKGIRLGLIRF
jgi:DNA-binding NarL/FixJ family response regulator